MSAQCSSCGAAIVWAVTVAGARMPVDAAPSPKGNLVLEGETVRVVPPPDLLDQRPRHTSHFATCPDAAQFRKPKVGRG